MSDTKRAPKRRKLVAASTDQNDVQVAGPSNRELASPPSPLPSIFKLTADCCDEIFEYLSLDDLNSFGKTCKTFQKVAGEYLKRNYAAYVFNAKWQMRPKTKCYSPFSQYINKIRCSDTVSSRYFAKHVNEYPSIKYLHCIASTMKLKPVKQKILPKIEFLEFFDRLYKSKSKSLILAVDVYKNLSEKCPNLKCLSVYKNVHTCVFYDHFWLHQVYPNLERLKLNHIPKANDLNIFFKKNPGVRTLSVQFAAIWKNKDSVLSSAIKLDLLEVDSYGEIPKWIELLNELHERGFYKRLYLDLRHMAFDQHWSDKLRTLQGLEKLTTGEIRQCYSLPQLTQLKRLDLELHHFEFFVPSENDFELLANGLVNLERIRCNYHNILPWLRLSKKLNKIRVTWGHGKGLDLPMLNKEREKLAGARKVTIYVDDGLYLATKWETKNGDTNLSLVEMRRSSSFDWDND